MKCCNNPIIQDFSFRLGFDDRVEHKYCGRCHAHKFRGQLWTAAQWSAWINAVGECQDIVEYHGGGKLQDWDDMELLKGVAP